MTRDPVAAILAAARHCYLQDGINDTGMADVAREAQLARSTLYRYFPSRDDVLAAVIKQEIEAVNITIQARLNRFNEPADVIVEGLLLALREIPRRPLLQAVFISDEHASARRAMWGSRLIIDFGLELMQAVIQPALREGHLQDELPPEVLTEWVHRLLISFLTLPSNCLRTEAELRRTLRVLLVPVLLKQG